MSLDGADSRGWSNQGWVSRKGMVVSSVFEWCPKMCNSGEIAEKLLFNLGTGSVRDLFEWLGPETPGSVCGFRFQFYCFRKIYTRLSQGRSKNTQRQSSQRLIRDSRRFLKTWSVEMLLIRRYLNVSVRYLSKSETRKKTKLKQNFSN